MTIDAIGCQKEIAQQIVDAGADYVLAVKDNQPTLHQDVHDMVMKHHQGERRGVKVHTHETKTREHGRDVHRTVTVMAAPRSWSEKHPGWAKLRSIVQVVTYTTRGAKSTDGVRYYISSLRVGAERLGDLVRRHWAIENQLHWTLDVNFGEDRSRCRKDHGPANLALLRRATISLLRQDTSPGSLRLKRKRAAWNTQSELANLFAKLT